ncbi:hypothetical protein P3T37_001025 [Kitasatospora sp. MAA4]|uniref:DUF4232 domain-containing protein n=1 Tax=Kitasatospora sp. MAA4 TaxID=3035093 RepID=UPI0024751143|nr:DUF4232 domain-containing protein [Kitasatospora sp. MAA4]MDH6131651.1 hypothetical protein [Kitasatospora sp. MAA4]
MRVQRALAASAMLVVTGLALTACQDDVTVSASTGGSPSASAPSSAKAPGGTGGGSSSGTTGSSSGGAGSKTPSSGSTGSKTPAAGGTAATAACATDNLITDVSAGNATPPSQDMASVTVSFYNKGNTCTLDGFAGVDLATSLGATSVPRGRNQPSAVTLAKSQDAMFTIWYRSSPKGHPGATVTTMTITPPGETHSTKMTWPGEPLATGADAGGTDTLYLEPVARHA